MGYRCSDRGRVAFHVIGMKSLNVIYWTLKCYTLKCDACKRETYISSRKPVVLRSNVKISPFERFSEAAPHPHPHPHPIFCSLVLCFKTLSKSMTKWSCCKMGLHAPPHSTTHFSCCSSRESLESSIMVMEQETMHFSPIDWHFFTITYAKPSSSCPCFNYAQEILCSICIKGFNRNIMYDSSFSNLFNCF